MSSPTFSVPPAAPADAPLTPGVVPGLPVEPADHFAGYGAEPEVDEAPPEPTTLAAMLADLRREVAPQERTWEVPTRPGWAVQYRTDITDAAMKVAQRGARIKGRKAPDGSELVDELKMGAILLGQYCTAVLYQGTVAETDRGDNLTFRSPELWGAFGARSVAECVMKFYATDGAVVSAGRVLINASGWTDDPDDVAGPTPA